MLPSESLENTSSICTLYEGHYHLGLGALVNSLHLNGYRGIIWVGYRGSLPPWSSNVVECDGYQQYEVAKDCCIRYIRITENVHFANYKPDFMLYLWQRYCSDISSMFYFDPDIVITCRWSFYEEWVSHGVALCQEIVNGFMPVDHPLRLTWKKTAEDHGYTIHREFDRYFNSGFIGLKKEHASFLEMWRDLIDHVRRSGTPVDDFIQGDRTQPFHMPDQDILNLTLTVTEHPLTTLGPEGMAFIYGGYTMAHATGTPKPWRKRMTTSALRGKAPTAADRLYWKNVTSPISLYSNTGLLLKQLDLTCASALGRFIRRS